jgi:hypothetical protein
MTSSPEIAAVRKALKENDIPFVSCKRGRGTAWGWINVEVKEVMTDARYRAVYQIIKKAAGRENLHDDIQSDYFIENISVTFTYPQNNGYVNYPDDSPSEEFIHDLRLHGFELKCDPSDEDGIHFTNPRVLEWEEPYIREAVIAAIKKHNPDLEIRTVPEVEV